MPRLDLVTGGAGFIGSTLVRALLAEGRTVRVLDDFSSGLRRNLEEVADRAEILEADVRDPDACRRACQGADAVFHLAAIASVPRSIEDPESSFQVNARGTFNMLMAARHAGARRFVFASSAAVYGTSEVVPKRETMPPEPASPYAADKVASEQYAYMFHRLFGLEAISLRYFNVFGPRQDPSNPYAGVIAAFAARMLRGKPPVIFGDGRQSRDFVFVDDVVHANLLAARAPEVHGQVVNIGTGRATDLVTMARTLNQVLGTDLEPIHKPPRAGDVRASLADISVARKLLGYEPAVSFDDGLARTLDWYRRTFAPNART